MIKLLSVATILQNIRGGKFTENATGDYDIDINVGKSILLNQNNFTI